MTQPYKQTPLNIPDKDFIMFIGTSHTYGECDKRQLFIKDRYSQLVAKELGVESLVLGYPGIDNLGLLQVVNELIQLEAFNKHCKMVVLEPRLGGHAIRFHKDIDHFHFDEFLDEPQRWNISKALQDKVQTHPVIPRGYSTMDNLFRVTGLQPIHQLHKPYEIPHYSEELIKQRLAFESATPGEAYNDAIMIQSIKNIISNLNGGTIKFSWLLIDGGTTWLRKDNERIDNIDLLRKIYGDWLDIWDDQVVSEDYYICHGLRGKQWNDARPVRRCECGHLNEYGNQVFAEAILPWITNRYKSI